MWAEFDLQELIESADRVPPELQDSWPSSRARMPPDWRSACIVVTRDNCHVPLWFIICTVSTPAKNMPAQKDSMLLLYSSFPPSATVPTVPESHFPPPQLQSFGGLFQHVSNHIPL